MQASLVASLGASTVASLGVFLEVARRVRASQGGEGQLLCSTAGSLCPQAADRRSGHGSCSSSTGECGDGAAVSDWLAAQCSPTSAWLGAARSSDDQSQHYLVGLGGEGSLLRVLRPPNGRGGGRTLQLQQWPPPTPLAEDTSGACECMGAACGCTRVCVRGPTPPMCMRAGGETPRAFFQATTFPADALFTATVTTTTASVAPKQQRDGEQQAAATTTTVVIG